MGEFCLIDFEGGCTSSMMLEAELSSEFMKDDIKPSKENGLFSGQVQWNAQKSQDDHQHAIFDVVFKTCAWNYAWSSQRSTKITGHSFCITIFQKENNRCCKILGQARSESFNVVCARRNSISDISSIFLKSTKPSIARRVKRTQQQPTRQSTASFLPGHHSDMCASDIPHVLSSTRISLSRTANCVTDFITCDPFENVMIIDENRSDNLWTKTAKCLFNSPLLEPSTMLDWKCELNVDRSFSRDSAAENAIAVFKNTELCTIGTELDEIYSPIASEIPSRITMPSQSLSVESKYPRFEPNFLRKSRSTEKSNRPIEQKQDQTAILCNMSNFHSPANIFSGSKRNNADISCNEQDSFLKTLATITPPPSNCPSVWNYQNLNLSSTEPLDLFHNEGLFLGSDFTSDYTIDG